MSIEIKPIKNERDYRKPRKEIDNLMGRPAKHPEGGRLDVLVTQCAQSASGELNNRLGERRLVCRCHFLEPFNELTVSSN